MTLPMASMVRARKETTDLRARICTLHPLCGDCEWSAGMILDQEAHEETRSSPVWLKSVERSELLVEGFSWSKGV
jgi:hypothetical protein